MTIELTPDEAQFIIAALNKVQLSGTHETLIVALSLIEGIVRKLQLPEAKDAGANRGRE